MHRHLVPALVLISFILLSIQDALSAEAPSLPIEQPLAKPGILLNFAPDEVRTFADKKLRGIPGQVVSHDSESMEISDGCVYLKKKGHVDHNTLLRWELPTGIKPGRYSVYTLFTLGGIADQTFTIRAGKDTAHMALRTALRQKNSGSWKMEWKKGQVDIILTPGDRMLEIEVSGKASNQKRIKAFFLDYQKPFGAKQSPVTEMKSGIPTQWLVTLSGGKCGLSLWGIDTEKYMEPCIGDPSLKSAFDSTKESSWRTVQARKDNLIVIEESTGNYSWNRGTGLANIYVFSQQDQPCVLHITQTGFATSGMVNGAPIAFSRDRNPPQKLQSSVAREVVSKNEQGTELKVVTTGTQAPVMSSFKLDKGWNRILLKLHMQHQKGETFAFKATFTDEQGKPLTGLKTCLNAPNTNLQLKSYARALNRFVRTKGINNILHPGNPARISYELLPPATKPPCMVTPTPPFVGELALKLTDYDGTIISKKRVRGTFPGKVDVDFGVQTEPGFYAVQAKLFDADGKAIHVFPSDGFSVVRGTKAQAARKHQKKMAVTYYFMSNTYPKAFAWMKEMGIYMDVGSSPGFPLKLADEAKEQGMVLTMDFWDYHNNYSQEKRNNLVKSATPYTRFFKSFNEIDIHKDIRMTPEKWTLRTKGEYEAVKAFGPANSIYVGGSLVRPASDSWFTECLKLGIDKYVDAWDVHAYPQSPPRLEGTCSNSSSETELGVENCYKRIGKTNKLPFWLGETGARSCHGDDARRWQADMVAKMTACICSREDFHRIGFLWPWQCIPSRRPNDISTSHNPADAALYTASALIDGFAYERLRLGTNIQAAKFGRTVMVWSEKPCSQVKIDVPTDTPLVIVDVVGRSKPLKVADGTVSVQPTTSPVYILPATAFDQLTAF